MQNRQSKRRLVGLVSLFLGALVLTTGCGAAPVQEPPAQTPAPLPPTQATPEPPAPSPTPAPPAPEPPAQNPTPAPPTQAAPAPPDPEAIRASGFKKTLHSINGKSATVYLSAADDRVDVTTAPWCGANTGDRTHTGKFAFYLQPEGSTVPERQPVAPWGSEPLYLNEARPQMLQVVSGQVGQMPDLLVAAQPGSCNGARWAVLALAPDGQSLVHYRFQTRSESKPYIFGQFEPAAAGQWRSSSYNNATGIYTDIDWAVRPALGVLEALQMTTRQYRP